MNEESRSVKLRSASLANAVGQTIHIATGLISVPLALNALGPQKYSLWMAMVSVVAFMYFADFGMSIGVQNKITIENSKNNKKNAAVTFQIGLAVLLMVSLVICAIGYLLAVNSDLNEYFKPGITVTEEETKNALIAMVVSVSLGVVSTLYQKTLLALQRSFVCAIIIACSRFVALACLYISIKIEWGLIGIIFSLNIVGPISIALLAHAALLYNDRWLFIVNTELVCRIGSSILRSTMSIGGYGLLASFSYLLINNTVTLVMTEKYGVESLVDYFIVTKITVLPVIFLTQVLSPLWPAVTDAFTNGNVAWIVNKRNQLRKIMMIITVAAVVLFLLLAPFVYKIWIPVFSLEYNLGIPCLLFMLGMMWNVYLSIFLNGIGAFKSQAINGGVVALLSFILAYQVDIQWINYGEIWIVAVALIFRNAMMANELNKSLENKL